ncbi:MAG: hypothetical protein AAF320_03370 [Myxococcota bacterium]
MGADLTRPVIFLPFFLALFALACSPKDRVLVLSEETGIVCDTQHRKIWSGPSVNTPQEADKTLAAIIENSGALGGNERWQCAQALAKDMHQVLIEESPHIKKTQDVLVIGAGAHAAVFLRVFDQAGEYKRKARVLTIESKSVLAEHFFSSDYLLNSPVPLTSLSAAPVPLGACVKRKFTPVLTVEPKSVLHEDATASESLGSTIKEKLTLFPLAQDTWAQIVMSHFLSPSSFAMGKQVQRIHRVKDGYEVEIEGMQSVTAKTVVVATGLGGANTLLASAAQQDWLQQQQQAALHCESPACLPRVMAFDDFLRLNRRFKAGGHNILNDFHHKRVALIGAGDASNVVVEFLYGAAPRSAYEHTHPTKHPEQLIWFGQQYTTYPQFFEYAKPRYRIAFFENLIQHKRVYNGSDEAMDVDFVATPNKVVQVAQEGQGGVQLTDSEGTVHTVDFAIVATGYTNQLLQVLDGVMDKESKGASPPFQALAGPTGSPMAYQLINRGRQESIYLIGTAALSLELGFVTKTDLDTSATQNAASFNILNPKTVAFARYLARLLP